MRKSGCILLIVLLLLLTGSAMADPPVGSILDMVYEFPDKGLREALDEYFASLGYSGHTVNFNEEFVAIGAGHGITNMKGMEYFENLQGLEIGSNPISVLDLTVFHDLAFFECDGTQLTQLSFIQCPKICSIKCTNSTIYQITLPDNPVYLTDMDVSGTNITYLNL